MGLLGVAKAPVVQAKMGRPTKRLEAPVIACPTFLARLAGARPAALVLGTGAGKIESANNLIPVIGARTAPPTNPAQAKLVVFGTYTASATPPVSLHS